MTDAQAGAAHMSSFANAAHRDPGQALSIDALATCRPHRRHVRDRESELNASRPEGQS